MCLVWVFSLGVLPALFHFALFSSVMSQDEPISSGVGPEVQEAIKEALSGLSASLTSIRLSSQGYRVLSGIWSRGVILRWLSWSSQLIGTKSSSNRRATESSSSISSKFLVALMRRNIPLPTLI